MGTRAAFWIGDPRSEDREWIGCRAWDGYPSNFEELIQCATEEAFRRDALSVCDATPQNGGWPYPWADDVFLTDYTYAWIDGQVVVTYFYQRFVPLATVYADDFEWPDKDDPTYRNIAAPATYDPSQPDSIMMISFGVKGE